MVKIGVIGSSEKIKSGLEYFQSNDSIELAGIFLNSKTDKIKTKVRVFETAEEVIQVSDAIYFAETNSNPFEMALYAVKNGKHVFLEQLSTFSHEETAELSDSIKEANVKCMTGSRELCRPAYLAVTNKIAHPLFIESVQSAKSDNHPSQNIIQELMLKHIAIIQDSVKSDIKRIWANGARIMSEQIDVANARLEFSNGCVAVLTVSYTADTNQSSITFYEQNKIIITDFQSNTAKSISREEEKINKTDLPVESIEQCTFQLQNFLESIHNNAMPLLELRKAHENAEIASRILKKINSFSEE